MAKAQVSIAEDTATLSDEGSLVGKLMKSCTGTITVKTPFGTREIKKLRNSKGQFIARKVAPIEK